MKQIFLAYIKVNSFSGQTASTILLKRLLLNSNNYEFIDILMYPIKRGSLFLSFFEWVFYTTKSLKSIIQLFIAENPILYINVGQSLFSFYRIGWWYVPIKLLKSRLKIVMSLNGSSFENWTDRSIHLILFRKLIISSDIVTVVGELQKIKLIEKGIVPSKIWIVSNSIDVVPNKLYKIEQKFEQIEKRPLNILFLSLLVEKKGFPEFLEALHILSLLTFDLKINAVLCGPITRTAFCDRFNSIEQARNWINNKITVINKLNTNVIVTWIEGAKGYMKKNLFDNADIFVLPTYYPNEAQPLVLLEAMATGCAIVTSKAGEITTTVSSNFALIMDEVTPENVCYQIKKYLDNPELIKSNAIKAHKEFEERFSLDVYARNWESIFDKLY
jgi:glycosyltransferase involved in cell wall biosynthesis